MDFFPLAVVAGILQATLFEWIYKNGDNNAKPVRIEVSSESAK